MRINLGAAFSGLFKGLRERKSVCINVVFKLYGGVFEIFYKDEEQSLSRQNMRMDGVIALNVNVSTIRIVQYMT
jgi:hypothetical protein